MTDNQAARYLSATQAVLDSAKVLRDQIESEEQDYDAAIDDLIQAAQRHNEDEEKYRGFMFSSQKQAAENEKADSEDATENILTNVLSDIQVANLLIAAGQAAGEIEGQSGSQKLDEVIYQLDDTTQTMKRALADNAASGRMGFAEGPKASPAVTSTDLNSAIDNFKQSSSQFLSTLVQSAQDVMSTVIKAMSKLDPLKIIEALDRLGEEMPALGKFKQLIRAGIHKLESAINTLIDWIGKEKLAALKGRVKEFWGKVSDAQDGNIMTSALEWVLDIKPTQDLISDTLGNQGLKKEAVDQASNAIIQLEPRYKKSMKIANGLTKTVGVGTAILAFTPVSGPHLVLGSAFAYAVILAAAVLIGMDYADSGRVLRRVRGVGEITRGMLS